MVTWMAWPRKEDHEILYKQVARLNKEFWVPRLRGRDLYNKKTGMHMHGGKGTHSSCSGLLGELGAEGWDFSCQAINYSSRWQQYS